MSSSKASAKSRSGVAGAAKAAVEAVGNAADAVQLEGETAAIKTKTAAKGVAKTGQVIGQGR